MSNYNTGNPVPSIDPRDLDDNATVFDELINSSEASVPDRLGVPRKTWYQMEQDAEALVSPNVAALAGLTGAANLGVYFTGVGAMATYSLTSQGRTILAASDSAAQQAALPWAAPLASPALTGTPTAPTPAVGTNTTQIATAAMFQAELANKKAWTNYVPTVTASTGTFTSASAAGAYIVLFGICYFVVTITVTTKGTGTAPIFTLPFEARTGFANVPFLAHEFALNGKSGTATINAARTAASCADYANTDLVTGNGAVIYVNGSYPIQ